MKSITSFALMLFAALRIFSQETVIITIDGSAAVKPISPYIFGRNNCLSDSPSRPLSSSEWQKLRDQGVRFFRENGGNNATKYNWRRKLTSHPDWYNNVYNHSWDFAAASLQENIPGAQGMWGFQLAGKAAKSGASNFNDWSYNGSQWWEGVHQNLAGGGTVNPDGTGDAIVEGNPDLYLENWNADSTTGILTHWLSPDGLGLNPDKLLFWNMDNEPEIWEGTHDDIWPVQPGAEEFMQSYFEVAKKARALFPSIKLMGPVPANEWQWYNYKGGKISYKGKEYVWLEYFILRIAEEQKATGIRLLDVLDIHFYPGEESPSDIVQLHRVYFDTSYIYPGANGVKRSGSSAWNGSINREYIFKRCADWLDQYMGPDHGVTFAVSETGINSNDPDIAASWYASTLGEFARQGVEVFTPWSWKTGMNEILHLFSRYSLSYYIKGTSSQELYVSAYPTMNFNRDSLVIFLVNRHLTNALPVEFKLSEFPVRDGEYPSLSLTDLPSSETFVSHHVNNLAHSTVEIIDNELKVILEPLSVTAVILNRSETVTTRFGELIDFSEAEDGLLTGVSISKSKMGYSGTGYVTGFDQNGDRVTVNITVPDRNFYRIMVRYLGTSGDKYQDISVNSGYASQFHLPASDTFAYADAGSHLLEKGKNTLSVIKNWGWSEIDRIEVYPARKIKIEPDTLLADTAASQVARDLFRYLHYQFGKRIISGQTTSNFNTIRNLTGQTPLLQAGDLYNYTDGYPYKWENGAHTFGKVDNNSVEELIAWYESTGKKGIISLQWHWCSPSGGSAGTNTFYTDFTSFDITRAVTEGTEEYDLILKDIDDIAIQLRKFKDAQVPVLWRPLHEAGGGWFWWGAKGPEACIKLYDILFDRLMNFHQMHNLIWVWSTPEKDWYPGNSKVDIIGYDSYPGTFNYGTQKNWFDILADVTGGKKLIAMTENGPIPDPSECLALDVPWLYFMSWADLVTEQNSEEHLRYVFSHPGVITLGSDNSLSSYNWHSTLYPPEWRPGYKDTEGHQLQDFSYAGYHSGLDSMMALPARLINVTDPPYNADNTGSADATEAIQSALDEAGLSGGGTVYLPEGTYRISIPENALQALWIRYDSTILMGEGIGKTFLLHAGTILRNKSVIRIAGDETDWYIPDGDKVLLRSDVPASAKILPLVSASNLKKGERIVIRCDITPEFAAEHRMSGYWDEAGLKGPAFLRTIDSVDNIHNLVFLDAPVRYTLKTRDNSAIYLAGNHISESGILQLSIGNLENQNNVWENDSWKTEGTGGWEVDQSCLITARNAENCMIRKVGSYLPQENLKGSHFLSHGIMLDQSRYFTIDSCAFQNPQYKEGDNGILFILQSNDCLISNCLAENGNKGFVFRYPWSSGNVVLDSRSEYSSRPGGADRYLSIANLFDRCTINSDKFDASWLPFGNPLTGYTSTHTVFYNTLGKDYVPGDSVIISSRQHGMGYVIGTTGKAYHVGTDPIQGISSGYYYNSSPRDFSEGVGKGAYIVPGSLYLDQLEKRKNDTLGLAVFSVRVKVFDHITGKSVTGAKVLLQSEEKSTGSDGETLFMNVTGIASITIVDNLHRPVENIPLVLYSDTTLVFELFPALYKIILVVSDKLNNEVFKGVPVSIGGKNEVTDSNGKVFLEVGYGIQSYSINKLNYRIESGEIDVQSDTTLEFRLQRIAADIKFRLKEEETPVNKAMVRLNEDTLFTNSLGIALFRSYPIGTDYSWEILREGFTGNSGTLFLTSDTLIDISMHAIPDGFQEFMNFSGLEIYPNPVSDVLNVYIPGNDFPVTLQILDLPGKVCMSFKMLTGKNQIPLGNLSAGAYILRVQSDSKTVEELFLKK